MNQANDQINQNIDAFAKAEQLRAEAEALETKERMRRKLEKLIEISQDSYYDQYLAQMMKDLESGKATPRQIAKEADRTYRLYQQRMGQVVAPQNVIPQNAAQKQTTNSVPAGAQSDGQMPIEAKQVKTKDTVEFKIGAGIFSTLGAVFVLAALVIFGFNFLEGFWQGLCLYVAAVAVILISELAIKRLSRTFALVITEIGISSLFITTVINYLVLNNINGLMASFITIAIALFSIFFSRKKNVASIRLISCLGGYICFLPIRGFESELSFLIMMGMVFAINLASVLLTNQKGGALIGSVHMIAHVIFTGAVTGMVLADGMDVMYVSFFVILSLVLLNLIYFGQKDDLKTWYTVLYSVILGFFGVILICVACLDYGIDNDKLQLFYKLMTEIMAVAVAFVFYILWGQKRCRWIQYYFVVAIVIFFNGLTDYNLEATVGTLLVFVITRLLCREKELRVLDSILTVAVALQGIRLVDEWYVIPFVIVMVLSIFTIQEWHIFHEIVTTIFVLSILLMRFDSNWILPISVGVLFVLFLLFNHLPRFKDKTQLPYNIVNIVFAGLLCLFTAFCDEYWINSVTMLVGTVILLVAFRKRYGMEVQRKYLLLVGYLIYMIFAAGFEIPIVVSILLMVVAIGCVGVGFKQKDKVYRICGLVMAILVCAKLIIYDLGELESMAKVLLFLIVGVIALAISFLYIFWEKREDVEEKDLSGEKLEQQFEIVEETQVNVEAEQIQKTEREQETEQKQEVKQAQETEQKQEGENVDPEERINAE